MIRLIIVDDDPIVSESLKMIIEKSSEAFIEQFTVLETGHNGHEAIRLYRSYQPDIILLDIRMPECNGIEAGETILREFPEAKILYLTTFLEEEYIVSALRHGAKGYLMKSSVKQLLPALYAIYNGQSVFDGEILDRVSFDGMQGKSHSLERPKFFQNVSEREWEMIQYIADGKNNKEIAQIMHFSEGTVRNYISKMLEDLELRDRTQLAIQYYKTQG